MDDDDGGDGRLRVQSLNRNRDRANCDEKAVAAGDSVTEVVESM